MEYFYTPSRLIGKHELTIEGDEFAHLTHVMRKMPGDSVRVVNGAGTVYDVTIIDKDKHTARCEITAMHQHLNEPEVNLTLGVAILKNPSRFEFLVEKATELGVNAIVPLLTERTINRHAKIDRWQKLALAAMKQSERCVLPRIHETSPFEDFISSPSAESLRIVPHEKAQKRLGAVLALQPSHRTILCIGPEGGFSDSEIAFAEKNGFQPVSLGVTRLRTETAAVVASAAVLMHG